MASLIHETNGTHRILFTDPNGKRKTLRLGKLSKKMALTIKTHVEHLAASLIAKSAPDDYTNRWLADIGDNLAEKLAAVGLISPRGSATIAGFIDAYIESRKDAKPSTVNKWKSTRKHLVAFFGADRSMRGIKPGEADEFRQYLVNEKKAEATISKTIIHCRQFFKMAFRKGLVSANPFTEVRSGSQKNPTLLQFIERDIIQRVLNACPSLDWRVIVCLARYGGMRTPSETLNLKWSDINWETEQITIPSPKGEIFGKPYRPMPLFPELKETLTEAFEAAPEGSVYVVQGYRATDNQNLRTHFKRIIKRAGVAVWPRLFHNLRASRETELADTFPIHVVTSWLGNTPDVAAQHYLKTTDAHFQRALSENTELRTGKRCTLSDSVAQNPAQSASELSGQAISSETPEMKKARDLRALSTLDDQCTYVPMPPVGLEPTTR